MPKYRLIEMPDLGDTGKRRVYPKLNTYETVSTEKLIKKMVFHNGALSPSVIEAVIADVGDMIVKLLSAGHKVKLDGLGTFSLALGFKDDESVEITKDSERIKKRKVGVKSVNFKPSPDLIKSLKMTADKELKREMPYAKVIKKDLYDKQERIDRALSVIENNGFISLTDYAQINNISRAAASLELKEIDADKTSPIMSVGKCSHKVWVKRKKDDETAENA